MIWYCPRCMCVDIDHTPQNKDAMKYFRCKGCNQKFALSIDGKTLNEALGSPSPKRRQM